MDRLESMSTLLAAVEAGSLRQPPASSGCRLRPSAERSPSLRRICGTAGQSDQPAPRPDRCRRSYVIACKRIFEDIGEAERAAAGEYIAPRGDLIITAPIVFGRLHVLPVAIEFLKAYPDIDIRIALADRVVNLQEDDIHLAIRIGELPDSSLVATRVGSIRHVVCAKSCLLRWERYAKKPGRAHTHDCITFEGLASPDGWKFGVGKSTTLIAIHSRLVVNTAEAAIDAAIAGVGITRVLSYQAASAAG